MIQSPTVDLAGKTSGLLTGIPASATVVFVSIWNVLKPTTDSPRFSVGPASGIVAAGYDSMSLLQNWPTYPVASTAGVDHYPLAATWSWTGQARLVLHDKSLNKWSIHTQFAPGQGGGSTGHSDADAMVALSGPLERVQLSCINLPTFTSGKISYIAFP